MSRRRSVGFNTPRPGARLTTATPIPIHAGSMWWTKSVSQSTIAMAMRVAAFFSAVDQGRAGPTAEAQAAPSIDGFSGG